MRSRLLISVSAAALIAGVGLATAQDKGGPAAPPQNSSPAQQSAPPASQPGGSGTQGGADIQQRQEAPPARAQQDMNRGEQQQRAQDQREQRQDQRNQRGNQAEDKSAPKAGSTATDTKSDRKGGATTGQGAAGSGAASLTSEQRTKISTTIRQSNVKRVTNVNFNVSVGTVVPRGVTLHALPASVVEVYPQWRGYRFILVEDEIVVIEPGSFRIVAVIDA
jgi:hypothetical protein